MDKWIPIVSGLAAFVTAIATLALVWEMRKQRATMYLPDFSFITKTFYLYEGKNGNLFFSTSDTPNDSDTQDKFGVEIINLGLGAAKNVTFNWEFDIAELLRIIKKYDVYDKSEINLKGALVEFKNVGGHLSNTIHVINNQLKDEASHIIPMHVQSSLYKVKVPDIYEQLYLHFLYYSMYLRQQNPTPSASAKVLNIEEPPPLKLKMVFRDIENNVKHLNFILRPHLYMFGKKEVNDLKQWMFGKFQVERIKD